MSERLACKAVGLARSTYRRLPVAVTPADPDAQLRVWLRAYATKHPCHGFRRAWAALRHDEGHEVNVKKVHRLWREEGLQRRVHSPRKRAGVSSIPLVVADAPKVVWAIDFQFDIGPQDSKTGRTHSAGTRQDRSPGIDRVALNRRAGAGFVAEQEDPSHDAGSARRISAGGVLRRYRGPVVPGDRRNHADTDGNRRLTTTSRTTPVAVSVGQLR
jgi:hypothetical protein